jgi:hypothetical protein
MCLVSSLTMSHLLTYKMCLMNNVFSENVNKLILEFLYDILIYSKSKEDEEHYCEKNRS